MIQLMLKGLAQHLRDRRERLVRRVEVRVINHDPTYGVQSHLEDLNIVDFDALLREIDEFAETFK